MKRINLVLRPINIEIKGETIGVDSGALYCLDNGIEMKLALGDFDSISFEDFKRLEASGVKIIKFSQEKNEIDFELALDHVTTYDEIYVYGGLGNRRDHEYTLMKFVMADERIIVIDKENRIQVRTAGTYTYPKRGYKYLSIIPLEKGLITLEGFKYPLKDQTINTDSYYLTSNEIVTEGVIKLDRGKVLIIESN